MMTLAIGAFGYWFLYMRNNLVTVLTEDYILTARAKGLDENQVLYKHGLIEPVFSWRGLGRYIFDSLIALDFPVIQAIFLIIAIVTILANFVADMLYGVLDPRIKYG